MSEVTGHINYSNVELLWAYDGIGRPWQLIIWESGKKRGLSIDVKGKEIQSHLYIYQRVQIQRCPWLKTTYNDHVRNLLFIFPFYLKTSSIGYKY